MTQDQYETASSLHYGIKKAKALIEHIKSAPDVTLDILIPGEHSYWTVTIETGEASISIVGCLEEEIAMMEKEFEAL